MSDELGFAVQAFSSAEEFLASDCFSQTRCLILDIAMPGMSGLFKPFSETALLGTLNAALRVS